MSETYRFALVVLLASAAMLAAVLASRLTERLKIPAPQPARSPSSGWPARS